MSDPITGLKRELLAAAERQYAQASVGDRDGLFARRRRRSRVFLVAAVLPVVAIVALLFTTPWSSRPSFLARAEAGLTPGAGTVLHMKWETTTTSRHPACTVTRGPDEIWIDETPPHSYRVLLNDLTADPGEADPRELACAGETAAELGGQFDTGPTLRFVPPDRLSVNPLTYVLTPNPVTALREAIAAGRARDEGTTQFAERTVERIRIDLPPACYSGPGCHVEPSYWYVDHDTFYPVASDGPAFIAGSGDEPVVRQHIVTRYLKFEFLPRTTANLALTDIHAQHPDATGP